MNSQELNEAVARKMGQPLAFDEMIGAHIADGMGISLIPAYDRDIKAAWEIVEYLRERKYFVNLLMTPVLARCEIHLSDTGSLALVDEAPDALPRAICKAFLSLNRP